MSWDIVKKKMKDMKFQEIYDENYKGDVEEEVEEPTKTPNRSMPTELNGKKYPSQKAAAEANGMTPQALNNYLNNKSPKPPNFRGYKL